MEILTPSGSSIFKDSLGRKRNIKNKTINKRLMKTTRTTLFTVFILFAILPSFCGFTYADYYPPAPPPSNVARETWVSVASTEPASKIHINITEYDVQHMVKNITIELRETASYLSLVIYILKDKPFVVNAPDNIQVIQYYAIRFAADLAEKITNVTIFFAIEKAAIQNQKVKAETILHYQYEGNKFESCPTQRVAEDDVFLYFKTETKESPYFAIAGSLASPPWWLTPLIITIIVLFTLIGIHVYKRYEYPHLRTSMENKMENNDIQGNCKETKDVMFPLAVLSFLACAWLVYVSVNSTWITTFKQAMSWIISPKITYTPIRIEGAPLAFLATIEVLIVGFTSSHMFLADEKDRCIRVLSVLGLGFGLATLVTIILGVFGKLYQLPLNIILLSLCLGFLSVIVYRQRGNGKISIREFFKIRLCLDKVKRLTDLGFWLLAYLAIIVIFFFCFYHALFTVILHWDAIVYHAAMSAIMYNNNGIPLIAGPSIGIQMSANFPPLLSALGAYYYIQIGAIEDIILRVIPPIMGVLTVASTYKIGEVMAGKKFGIISALFLAMTPMFFRYSMYATSYSMLAFFCTASVLLLLLATIRGNTRYWVVCGLFYGFALLTSYLAIYLVPFLMIALIYYFTMMRNFFKIKMKKALALFLSTLIIGGVWYFRNLILLRNPIYPNAYSLLGGININPLILETTFKGIKWSATVSFFGGEVSLLEKIGIFFTFRTHFPAISLLTILGLFFIITQDKKFWLLSAWPLSLSVFVLSGVSWGFPRHIVFAIPGFALLSALPIYKAYEHCEKHGKNIGHHTRCTFAWIRVSMPSMHKSQIITCGFAILILAAFLFPSLTFSMGGKITMDNLYDEPPDDYLWLLENPNSDKWVVLNKLYPEAVAWNWLNEHLNKGEKVATVENRIYYVKNCSNDYFFYLDGWEARQLYNITDPAAMLKFLRDENVKYIVDVDWARKHGHFDILPMSQFLGSPSPYFPTLLDCSGNPNIYNVGPYETPITANSPKIISINQEGWSELQLIDGTCAQSVIAGSNSARLYVATPNLTSVKLTYHDVGKEILSINVYNPFSQEWIYGYGIIQKNDTGKWKNYEFLVPLSLKGYAEIGLHAYTENFTISKIEAKPFQADGRTSLEFLKTKIANTTNPPTLMIYLPFLNENGTILVQTNSSGKKICLEIFEGIIQPWETTGWWMKHELAVRTPNSTIYGQVDPSLVWKTAKSGLYTLVIVLREEYAGDTRVDLKILVGGTL